MSRILRFLFPTTRYTARASLFLLALRVLFGVLLFCSVGFIVGAFYRLALIPMIFTMCVALFVVHGDDPFAVKELAAIYLSVFVLMYISGPGNYALDRLIAERLRN